MSETAAPRFNYYKPHPLLAIYPEASPADLRAVQCSVAKIGVQEKIWLWQAPGGKTWCIDGRTRQNAAHAEFEKKVAAGEPTNAENGLPLQPDVEWFTGTQDEVYEFIKVRNKRKHYNLGQKAVIAVRQYYLEFMKRHGITKLPNAETEVTMEGALTAAELAEHAGCNELYIRDCKMLYREATDLLDACGMGVIPPTKAMRQYKARLDGKGETDKDTDGSKGKNKGAKREYKDADGNEVPERLNEAWEAVGGIRAVNRALEDCIRKVEIIAQSKGGGHIDMQAFEKIVKAAKRNLTNSRPELVCGDCEGSGRNKSSHRPCKRCGQNGYVSPGILKAEKKMAETAGSEAEAGAA